MVKCLLQRSGVGPHAGVIRRVSPRSVARPSHCRALINPLARPDVNAQAGSIAEAVEVAEEVRGDKDLVKILSPNYDILKFLHPVNPCRLRRIRLAAALAAKTYHMRTITESGIKRKFGLNLVTTSLHWVPPSRAALQQPSDGGDLSDVFEYGDGMAPPEDAIHASRTVTATHQTRATQGSLAALRQHYPDLLHEKAKSTVPADTKDDLHLVLPTGAVTTAKAVEWAEPNEAELRQCDFVPSGPALCEWDRDGAGQGLLNGLSRTMNAVGSVAARAASAAASARPVAASMHAVGGAWNSFSRTAAAGQQSLSVATISSVTAIAAAGSKLQELSGVGWVSGVPAPKHASAHGYSCSCHWFVADEEQQPVRHFVIQGTDCLESWKTNLSFEPVEFESPELRSKVHRGVYESAIVLYDVFEPLVVEHLQRDGNARVAFSGHSLGGSLATVLALMFRHRGVIERPAQLDGVMTFGTAAVFCETVVYNQAKADEQKGGRGKAPAPAAAADQVLDSSRLLERLGLSKSSVTNVMTTRDIVPRAFACDYKLVASVLQSWGPTYADHHGLLASNRPLLYSFAGEQMLLQPSSAFSWVTEAEDASSMLMPPGPGLWLLAPPTAFSRMTADMFSHQRKLRRALATGSRILTPRATEPYDILPEAESVSEALLHCMDNPHPFAILGDARAYGPAGAISRYHNPDNYAMAVRDVAVRAFDFNVQLLMDVFKFQVQMEPARSATLAERVLADLAAAGALLQQAGAIGVEASTLLWAQTRRAAQARTRALLSRDDVSDTLGTLASRARSVRRQTTVTASSSTAAVARLLHGKMLQLRPQQPAAADVPAHLPASLPERRTMSTDPSAAARARSGSSASASAAQASLEQNAQSAQPAAALRGPTPLEQIRRALATLSSAPRESEAGHERASDKSIPALWAASKFEGNFSDVLQGPACELPARYHQRGQP